MTMKQMKQWLTVAAVVALCGMMLGCKGIGQRPVNGTIEEPIHHGDVPETVENAMKNITQIDDCFETVMEDKTNQVAVYSMLKVSDTVSSEGYGMVVTKGNVNTVLPQIRHGNMPRARYDAATGDLWIVGSDMEGTGVLAECLYWLRFLPSGHAFIAGVLSPYEIQEAVREVLSYNIKGQDITFYSEGKELVTVTNHIHDMGDFMDDAIYIGEQISYSIEGPLTVHVTPGLNFVKGKVLHYDDMPTFSGTVTLDEGGKTVSLSELTVDCYDEG